MPIGYTDTDEDSLAARASFRAERCTYHAARRLLWKYLLSNLEYRKRSRRATEKASSGGCRRISSRPGSTCYSDSGIPRDGIGRRLLSHGGNRGFVHGAAFLLQFVWPRHLYVLVLRTSSGDVDALTSRKKQLVSNVVQALEQAFMIRAGQPASSAELGSEAAIRRALDVAARASHETMPRY
jgi:hypothetical protein